MTPGQIGTDSDWKQIAISLTRTAFAIKNDGTLWGWGLNGAALLGNNLLGSNRFPTQHNLDTDWDKMSIVSGHILISKINGTLWSWGGGGNGETGDGLQQSLNRSEPRQIGTDNNWINFAAGQFFSIGIKSDGTLWAWGKNDMYQLGDGTTINRPLPIQVGTGTNWQSVSCGAQSTAAIRTDGSLWTWGTNDYGQLGNGTTSTVTAPANIPVNGCTLNMGDFKAVANVLSIISNPALNELTLTYKGEEVTDRIQIYDLSGHMVFDTASVGSNNFTGTFSVVHLASGSYVLVLKRKGVTVVSKKFLKQ